MKRILLFCSLFLVTIQAYSSTCPPAPSGYIFRVGAWGDHVNSTSKIRCHYYTSDYSKEIELDTPDQYTAAVFANYPQWIPSDPKYYLCSPATNVNDCPFGYK